jgi:beta-lactamase regulating signal transducer with metallopeptidase domain
MSALTHLIGSLPGVCRNLLQVGIGLALQSMLLLAVGLLAGRHFRRRGPAVSTFVYKATLISLVLGALLAMPLGGRIAPLWAIALPPAQEVASEPSVADTAAVREAPAIHVPAPPGAGGPDRAGARSTSRAQRNGDLPSSEGAAPKLAAVVNPHPRFPLLHPPSLPTRTTRIGWLYVALVGIWIGGVVVLLAGLALCHGSIGRLRKASVPAKDDAMEILHRLCETRPHQPPLLRVSPHVRSPVLTGLWRPAILLPASYEQEFDPPALQAVLAHELAHLARGDCGWILFLRLACALGWIQPLVWVLAQRLEESSEEECDEVVLLQNTDPRLYAGCLVDLAERLIPSRLERSTGAGMASCRSAVERRVRNILTRPARARVLLTARLRTGVALGAAFVVALELLLVSATAAPPASPGAPLAGIPRAGTSAPAGGAGERRRPVLEKVSELDKPVTYTETKIPLGELVQKVAADTGAPLAAAPDVADEPVAVVVKDLPARELLEQLAALLDYQWARHGKEGAWRYEVWQDLASKQREEAFRQAALAGAQARLQAQIAQAVAVATLPPAELQRLAQEYDRWHDWFYHQLSYAQRVALGPKEWNRMDRPGMAFRLASPVNHALAVLLGRLTPPQWAVLRAGQPLIFSSDAQPGQLLLPEEMVRTFRSARPNMDDGWRYADAAKTAQEQQRQRGREAQWAAASGYQVTIRAEGGQFRQHVPLPMLSMHASAAPIVEGKPVQTGDSGPLVGTSLSFEAGPVDGGAELQQDETPVREAALAQDPVVGMKRVFKRRPKPAARPGELDVSRWSSMRELLPDLARIYGVSIIADSYDADHSGIGLPGPEPIALYQLLDRFVGMFYHWDHRGNLVRLRFRDWFLSRPKEVPMRLVRRWGEMLDRYGALPLAEFVSAAATLNDGQLESADGLLQSLAGRAKQPFGPQLYPPRQALRLYAALMPGQQQWLWRGQPLTAAAMTPAQRAIFLAAMQDLEHSRQPDAPDSSRLTDLPPDARFSLTNQRLIRVVERGADSTTIYSEPAPATPAATPASPVAPRPATRTPAVSRQPFTNLTFELLYSPQLRDRVEIAIASPR